MADGAVEIALAGEQDKGAIWSIMEPILREGDTYALPSDWTAAQGLDYWFGGIHEVFVAKLEGEVVGTFFLCPNQKGAGAHVANCGFMTSTQHRGKHIARTMGLYSLQLAKEKGFKAMQYNYVVSANVPAVKVWKAIGMEIVGTLPGAFKHPKLGFVDVYVMFQTL